MLIQIFGVTNKEHYGILKYFLEWSVTLENGGWAQVYIYIYIYLYYIGKNRYDISPTVK